MDTSISEKKPALIQWLTALEDEATIQKLLQLREAAIQDDWLPSSGAAAESIRKGIAEASQGKLNEHPQAKDIYGEWL